MQSVLTITTEIVQLLTVVGLGYILGILHERRRNETPEPDTE